MVQYCTTWFGGSSADPSSRSRRHPTPLTAGDENPATASTHDVRASDAGPGTSNRRHPAPRSNEYGLRDRGRAAHTRYTKRFLLASPPCDELRCRS